MIVEKQELSYRTGTVADREALRDIGMRSYGEYAEILEPEHWQNMQRNLESDKHIDGLLDSSTVFVCEHNGAMIGVAYLVGKGHPTDIFEEGWTYIRMVGVLPEYRGNGIARELTMMCINEARRNGEPMIALHTSEFMNAARHVYESIGFRVLKEIPLRLGKRYWLYTMDI